MPTHREVIEKAFSQQLRGIKDPVLRSQVVDIWVQTAEKGGWEAGELAKIPFTLLVDPKGISLIEHTIAVTQGALGLAKAMEENYLRMPFEIKFDWLIAGGLLHDVGKLLEIERTGEGFRRSHSGRCLRHPISGAIAVAQAGLPDEIINIVACHSKEGEGRPQRVETVLIHQADFALYDPMAMMEKGLLIT